MRCALIKCRATMTEVMDRLGRLSWRCDVCARRKAGVCKHCPRKVVGTVGRSHFCAECRAAKKKVVRRAWINANRDKVRKSSRKYRRKNRQTHRAACKRWRENNKRYNTIRMRAYRWSKRGKLAPAKPLTRSECGRLGGKKGSAARIASIGPERVKEIARIAREARWAKHRARQAALASQVAAE